ncbi:MAG TPA: hypothetical protein VF444_10975 [Pseudonocardiaceae bacterium]
MIDFAGVLDFLVAVAGRSTMNVLQSADIIVGSHSSWHAGRQWIASVFAEYPGCMVAVSWNPENRSGLFMIREVKS